MPHAFCGLILRTDMKHFLIFLVIITVSYTNKVEKKGAEFTYPPEWAAQESVWIDFPDESEWGGGMLPADHPARIEMIKSLVKHVPVNIILPSDDMRKVLLNWFGGGIHCQTMQVPKVN